MKKRLLLPLPTLILAVVLAAGCAAYRYQHAATAPASRDVLEPVPAGADFLALPAAERVARVRGEGEAAKAALEAEGKYACCVRPSCNECLHRDGECHCREVAEKGGPCCGECTRVWTEQEGKADGTEAWKLLVERLEVINDPAKAEARDKATPAGDGETPGKPAPGGHVH